MKIEINGAKLFAQLIVTAACLLFGYAAYPQETDVWDEWLERMLHKAVTQNDWTIASIYFGLILLVYGALTLAIWKQTWKEV